MKHPSEHCLVELDYFWENLGCPIANSRGIGDQVFQVVDIQSPEQIA